MMHDSTVLAKGDRGFWVGLKCVMCGNIVDEVILKNQLAPAPADRKTYTIKKLRIV